MCPARRAREKTAIIPCALTALPPRLRLKGSTHDCAAPRSAPPARAPAGLRRHLRQPVRGAQPHDTAAGRLRDRVRERGLGRHRRPTRHLRRRRVGHAGHAPHRLQPREPALRPARGRLVSRADAADGAPPRRRHQRRHAHHGGGRRVAGLRRPDARHRGRAGHARAARLGRRLVDPGQRDRLQRPGYRRARGHVRDRPERSEQREPDRHHRRRRAAAPHRPDRHRRDLRAHRAGCEGPHLRLPEPQRTARGHRGWQRDRRPDRYPIPGGLRRGSRTTRPTGARSCSAG